jgi:hypothetical protein
MGSARERKSRLFQIKIQTDHLRGPLQQWYSQVGWGTNLCVPRTYTRSSLLVHLVDHLQPSEAQRINIRLRHQTASHKPQYQPSQVEHPVARVQIDFSSSLHQDLATKQLLRP